MFISHNIHDFFSLLGGMSCVFAVSPEITEEAVAALIEVNTTLSHAPYHISHSLLGVIRVTWGCARWVGEGPRPSQRLPGNWKA
jgi:hypothetical protein